MKLTKENTMDYKETDLLVRDVSKAYVKAYGVDAGYAMAVGFLTANMTFLLTDRYNDDIKERVVERCKTKITELLIKSMSEDTDDAL